MALFQTVIDNHYVDELRVGRPAFDSLTKGFVYDFCRCVNEIFALLGYYETSVDIYRHLGTTYWSRHPVSSSPKILFRLSGP